MSRETLHYPSAYWGKLWRHDASARRLKLHSHDELEMNLVINGKAVYLIDGVLVPLREGQILWLFPEEQHVLVERESAFRMWIGVFKPKLVARVGRSLKKKGLTAKRNEQPITRFLSKKSNDSSLDLLEYLYGRQHCLSWFNDGLSFLLGRLWLETLDAREMDAFERVHPAVEKAARFLQSNPEIKSLSEIAAASGLNRWNLSALFKEQMGMPITTYRQRLAIERFLEIYGKGERWNVTEAAFEAGFGSYPQFHRCFRRFMGAGPRRFLKRRSRRAADLA